MKLRVSNPFRPHLLLLAAGSSLLAISSAHAATLTWDVATGDGAAITDGSGTWSDAAGNWNDAGTDVNWANATPDDAIFGGGTAGTFGTATLTTSITAGSLTFNTPNGGGACTIDTSTFGLTLNTGIIANESATIQSGGGSVILGATNAWSVATPKTLTVSSTISGTGFGITKTGDGILTLSGANGYTDATTISAGILNIQHNTALGTIAGGVSVTTGAALEIQGGISVGNEALALNGTGIASGGALRNISGTNTYAGLITLGSATRINSDAGLLNLNVATGNAITGTHNLTFGGAGNITVADAIATSTGTLIKDGAGILTLSAANTYTGTTIVNGGELRWGADNALGSGDLTVNSGGTVTMDTFTDTVGTITLNRGTINVATGFVSTKSLKTGSGGFITTGGTVINWPGIGLGGNFAYNTDSGNETTAFIQGIDFNGGSRTFNIADGVQAIDVDITVSFFQTANSNRDFIKTGAGTMRISGGANENFNLGTGVTTIQDGTLLLNKANNENAVGGFGLVTVGNGTGSAGSAILRYVGGNDQITTNAITINSDGLFDLNGKTDTVGALTHSSGGSLTTGVGTLTLGAATNTISGTSTVTGNLTFSGTAATNLTLGGTANINGTTTFSGGNNGGITSTGTPQIQGTLALGTANRSISVTSGTLTIGAQITGSTGTTTKSGAGTLALTNSANSYSGALTISAGTLKLGANDVIPASNVAIGAATLDADTRTDTVGTLDVTGAATINLGVGAALAFADSKAVDWTGGTLNITGTLEATSLRFGDSADDLTSGPSGQLAKISVNGSGLGTYVLDANGYLVLEGGDVTPPTLTSITDDSSGGPVTVGTMITYTVTFNEDMNAGTVDASDFNNAGTAAVTIGSVTETTPGVFTVQATPTSAGSLTLRIAGLILQDTSTNNLVVPLSDDTTITVQTAYDAWAGGALFNQDANNDGVKNGLAFLLGAASPTSAVTPPTVTQNGGDLILDFNCLPDAARGSATLRVEHSSDLGLVDPWTATTNEVPDETNAVPDNNVTFEVAAGPVGPPALNSITATIDSAAAAGNKLFGRLKAVETP